jgi:uncharacterized protein YgiM (DUF1202 family)
MANIGDYTTSTFKPGDISTVRGVITINGTNVNMRHGAGTNFEVACKSMVHGDSFNVFEVKGDWLKTKYGWVFNDSSYMVYKTVSSEDNGSSDDNSSSGGNTGTGGTVTTVGLPQAVLRWESMVKAECAKQGVPGYTPYALAIIMMESTGNDKKYPDIMQSSESQGWPRNTIKNTKDSIHYGIMHLKNTFAKAKTHGINDIGAILQGYNSGHAYLSWLDRNNKKHSLKVSDEYSRTVVAPSLGNTTGKTIAYNKKIAKDYNGGTRYLNGGNMYYGEEAKQYLKFSGGSIGGNGEIGDYTTSTFQPGNISTVLGVVTINGTNVNMRHGAGTNFDIACKSMVKGDSFNVYEVKGSWLKTKYGWVFNDSSYMVYKKL